ncbi:PE-PPE domain-containing protein [Gordonia terrae]|uniref:PE-PPE domain-containing protein n=1 Tax=Gordonia terrae TaxID=2055 RepID=UPI003F6C3A4D
MTPVSVLMLDGTWSRPRARSAAAESLRRSLRPGYEFSYVDYPAAFGPATGIGDVSPAESIRIGAENVARAVELTPHPAVIACYSQGVMAAYKFVREILPHRPWLDVRAIAAMGNPHEPSHAGGRGGIADRLTLPKNGPRLLSVWAPGDPIADIVANAPIRSAWNATEWMSVRDFPSAVRWVNDVTDNVIDDFTDGVEEWWQRPDILASLRAANAYLFGTTHTTDYARFGHATRLARQIETVGR